MNSNSDDGTYWIISRKMVSGGSAPSSIDDTYSSDLVSVELSIVKRKITLQKTYPTCSSSFRQMILSKGDAICEYKSRPLLTDVNLWNFSSEDNVKSHHLYKHVEWMIEQISGKTPII